MKKLSVLFAVWIGSPALAAGDIPFFSLYNTNFVVWLAFLLFVGILIYLKVPGKVGGMLDQRADSIRKDLAEAKALHDDARSILATYERKQREVQEQADRIVETAKHEAALAATKAKDDLQASIVRRLAAAEDQIASAQAAAIKDVRDRAIQIAVAAAGDVVAANMTAADSGALIDDAIDAVGAKLH